MRDGLLAGIAFGLIVAMYLGFLEVQWAQAYWMKRAAIAAEQCR